ncbi:hypothetical protein [Pseudomonas rossensis]|uniref:hypothetical protein n=1 Tax=Pseudomonas rossensis TaxID=2305471 RepID=UPI003260C011
MTSFASNEAALPSASMQLVKDDSAGAAIYSFYDSVLQGLCQSDKIKVRQVITLAQFIELSRARHRLYGQRKVYYKTLFGDAVDDTVCLDEYDPRSYVFAFYYDGEIIGTQRITPFPHESGEFIKHEELVKFSGPNYEGECVELSRLIVDKHSPVKNVANGLAMTGASLVALQGGYKTFKAGAKIRQRRVRSGRPLLPDQGPWRPLLRLVQRGFTALGHPVLWPGKLPGRPQGY